MADDETVTTSEQGDSASRALLPMGAAAAPGGQWSSPPAFAQSAEPASQNVMAFVHALRRHWVMAVGLGLLCAAILGPAVWFGIGERYTADARLQVAMQQGTILSNKESGGQDRERFEIYKNTQQARLLDRFVLMAAIRKPEIARLPCIKAQEGADPVAWLEKRVIVSFPLKAEIMNVSVTRPDRSEATMLVNAVVDAYLTEVVNTEREKQQQNLSELDRAFTTKETEIRDKMTELKQLAERLGTDDRETLSLKQKLALEELNTYRLELTRLQFDIRRATSDLAGMRADLKSVEEMDVSDTDVEMLAANDPVAKALFEQLGWNTIRGAMDKSRVVGGKMSQYVERSGKDTDIIEEQLNARKAKIVDAVREKRRSQRTTEIVKLESSLGFLREQEKQLKEDVDTRRKDAEKFGNATVDMEMARSEIKTLQTVLARISNDRDMLSVEIRSTPRVTLLFRALVPEVPSNTIPRVALTLFGMMVGLCCPAVAVALLDTRAGRINDSTDVSKGLHLPVIGSMPLIPASVIHHLESPSKRYQRWQVRLTESVDGITARILRRAELEQCRVIMVSSASSGEGKTTLSTQLALSLARAGRRTVLVDFDLRRPSFDGIFGLPLEPGVCEMLRQQNPVAELVHPSATENLWVVTAGRWDRLALAALSNGSAAVMLRQIRDEYDFVVVDTSPILPVADARFVSQHVDSVVLSVFRDVSQAPRIQAACEILAAFGVQTVEAVVTTPYEHGYYGYKGYDGYGYGSYGAYGEPPSS